MDTVLMENEMSTFETMQIEDRHTSGVYAKREMVITHGRGALLYDDQGMNILTALADRARLTWAMLIPKLPKQ